MTCLESKIKYDIDKKENKVGIWLSVPTLMKCFPSEWWESHRSGICSRLPRQRVASAPLPLLLDHEMCLSLSFPGSLFFPFVPGVTARRYYKMREWGGREEMRGENGEEKRLLEDLSANIRACRGLFLLARGGNAILFSQAIIGPKDWNLVYSSLISADIYG